LVPFEPHAVIPAADTNNRQANSKRIRRFGAASGLVLAQRIFFISPNRG
jgi:hypothetical protein